MPRGPDWSCRKLSSVAVVLRDFSRKTTNSLGDIVPVGFVGFDHPARMRDGKSQVLAGVIEVAELRIDTPQERDSRETFVRRICSCVVLQRSTAMVGFGVNSLRGLRPQTVGARSLCIARDKTQLRRSCKGGHL